MTEEEFIDEYFEILKSMWEDFEEGNSWPWLQEDKTSD